MTATNPNRTNVLVASLRASHDHSEEKSEKKPSIYQEEAQNFWILHQLHL